MRLSQEQIDMLRSQFLGEIRSKIRAMDTAAQKEDLDDLYTVACQILDLVDQYRTSEAQFDELRRSEHQDEGA